jgi:ABC-type antimicrobial peptide transport system permease subunit
VWPVQTAALLYGLLGGAIGALLGLVIVTAIGGAISPMASGEVAFADWRLWGIAIGVTLAVGVAAMGGARLAVLQQLALMP